MKFLIIENEKFQSMQSLERAAVNQWQRREIRNRLLDSVQEALGRKLRLAKKAAIVIEEIIWKASDRGYSFNSREKLAELCDVSLRTVDNAIRLLKESGEVVVCYRENKNSNSARTPVVILRKHENFRSIAGILSLDCDIVCEEEKAEIPTASSDLPPKSKTTYKLTEKQESNNIQPLDKIIRYITYKLQNVQERSPYSIKYLGAYIEKMIRTEQRKALYEAARRHHSKKKEYTSIGLLKFDWLNT